MIRLECNPQFVNNTHNDLVPGKIHTLRHNYHWWKRFEGREVELYTWEGKPRQKGSRQKVFCVKKIISVQEVTKSEYTTMGIGNLTNTFGLCRGLAFSVLSETAIFHTKYIGLLELSTNDGLTEEDFYNRFIDYKNGDMAIIHFTDFRY